MNFDRYAGMASAVGIVLTWAIVVWLDLWGPISLERIKEWQTLIGGIITAAGILVAAWNVTRQMRLAAVGREQDRIERELPGVRDAVGFIRPLMIICDLDM